MMSCMSFCDNSLIHFTAALEGPILKFSNCLPEIIALETCQSYTLTVSFVYANEA